MLNSAWSRRQRPRWEGFPSIALLVVASLLGHRMFNSQARKLRQPACGDTASIVGHVLALWFSLTLDQRQPALMGKGSPGPQRLGTLTASPSLSR